jgi:ArsR family transcriptional regulator, virulence genes transcriptional regulator
MSGTSSNYWMILNAMAGDDAAIKVDFINLKKAAMILRALNHKLRQQIVRILDEHKKLTVTELYIHLRLEQSVASQHLAILRRAGIVKTERDGKFIHYTINPERIGDIMKTVHLLLV